MFNMYYMCTDESKVARDQNVYELINGNYSIIYEDPYTVDKHYNRQYTFVEIPTVYSLILSDIITKYSKYINHVKIGNINIKSKLDDSLLLDIKIHVNDKILWGVNLVVYNDQISLDMIGFPIKIINIADYTDTSIDELFEHLNFYVGTSDVL